MNENDKDLIAKALEENDLKRRKQQNKDVGNVFLSFIGIFLFFCLVAYLLMQ
jgi:flagellar biogenesis protein FliO